jgi:hypothetical protein
VESYRNSKYYVLYAIRERDEIVGYNNIIVNHKNIILKVTYSLHYIKKINKYLDKRKNDDCLPLSHRYWH